MTQTSNKGVVMMHGYRRLGFDTPISCLILSYSISQIWNCVITRDKDEPLAFHHFLDVLSNSGEVLYLLSCV
jgi:hypothetical protein